MRWLFKWWIKGVNREHRNEDAVTRAVIAANAGSHFDGGMTFQLVDAENGKILKVQIPDPNAQKHGFNPHGTTKEKLYVIPEGENVIEFITRALVEERIK